MRKNDDFSKHPQSKFEISNRNVTENLIQSQEDQTFYDKIIDSCGLNKSILKIYIIAILFVIADGGEMIVISLITTKLGEEWALSELQKGFLGSSIFIGYFIGAIFSGKISDNKGRKPILRTSSIIFTIFAFLSSFSTGFYSFLFFRSLCGFGIGLSIPALVTLLSEISPSQHRSMMINCLWLFFPIGEVIVIVIAKFFIMSPGGWRYVLIFTSVACFIAIILTFYIFESPKFLICNDRLEEGFDILNEMISHNSQPFKLKENEKKVIALELKEAEMNTINSDFKELITEKYLRLSVLVSLIFFFVCYIYYGLLYVLPQIMLVVANEKNKEDKFDFDQIYAGLIWSAISEIPGNIVAAWLANSETYGRKYSMAIGFGVTGVFMLFALINIENINFFASIIKFSISLPFNIIYLYTVEAYPTKIRSIALGASSAFARIGGIITPFLSQLFFAWNYKLPLLFYFFNSIFGVLCCLHLPFDTRTRTIH